MKKIITVIAICIASNVFAQWKLVLTFGSNIICAGSSDGFGLRVVDELDPNRDYCNGSSACKVVWSRGACNSINSQISTGQGAVLKTFSYPTSSTSDTTYVDYYAMLANGTCLKYTLTVLPKITPKTPTQIFGQSTVCQGQPYVYHSELVDNATAYSFYYSSSASLKNSGYSDSVEMRFTKSGYLNVQAVGVCANSAGSPNYNITVIASPPVPKITQVGSTLNSNSISGNQWYLNGNLISGANSSMYTAKQSGAYTVKVTGTNGCSSTSNTISMVVTGVEEYNESSSKSRLNIYPNPAQNEVSLTSQSPISGIFSLFNLQGQQVLEQNITGTQAKISLANLPQGIYQYELKDTNGKSEKGKLVVQ